MSLRQRPFAFQLIALTSFLLLASILGHAQCTGSGPYTCTETQSVVIPAGSGGFPFLGTS